ncbi:cofilin/actin-depolymerizing factor homolog [Limulus polyphemus]|uniref:Cofilin/actin-depolymerizing factor homolog n=1 Tax=Limulus polyphemus TaxID=6850 RepID=A0ABM1B6Q7_LIMPO|nr:cofilin/actin-depolymerizing factor homolog [Limulus polyphemus]
MASGVTVSTESKTAFDEVKKAKKFRYIIYYIKDEKTIDVEAKGERDTTYENFLSTLDQYKTECRYCVFDFPVSVAVEGSEKKPDMTVDRLVLMSWCPDSSPVKQKMLYSSSFDALKKALVGVYKYIQACDFEEVAEEAINESLKKGGK